MFDKPQYSSENIFLETLETSLHVDMVIIDLFQIRTVPLLVYIFNGTDTYGRPEGGRKEEGRD